MTGRLWLRGLVSVIGRLAATWRYEITGAEHLRAIRPRAAPAIWALWHGDVLPLLWLHRQDGTTLLVSRHRDGDYFDTLARRWGYRTLRGSSTRGGVAALLGLIRTLRGGGQVAVAADGPRGPRGRAKPGAVAAAARTGAPIFPVAAAASPAWRLTSWDGFLIPGPGARIRVVYGAPLLVSPGGDGRFAAAQLQEQLDYVSRQAAC